MRLITALAFASVVRLAGPAAAQPAAEMCPPAGWSVMRLTGLKGQKFAIEDDATRRTLALGLTGCLGDPNPALRDGIAFEALTAWMRAGQLDRPTLIELRERLMTMLTSARQPQEGVASTSADAGFRGPFAALVLAEVARTDRVKAWHGVAHGADFALQLALNPAVTKAQLDRLLTAIVAQVAPRFIVSYTAGEPDRLARPVLFIAQRALHTDEEWKAWFAQLLSPAPIAGWDEAFSSEAGLAKRHNTRAFLLSLYASASVSENPGVRQLLGPVREGLKQLP